MKTTYTMDDGPLQEFLDELALAGRRIARHAVGKGASVAARAMRNAATSDSVKQSIGWRFEKSQTRIAARVGVNVGKRPNKRTRWAAAQVLGTKPRYRKTNKGRSAFTGVLQPNQAVGRAVAASRSQISDAMTRTVQADIQRLGDQ